MQQKWYKSWFNSPYYHQLYKNRDMAEAEHFMDHLMDFIRPQNDAKILDIACGKGRHSIYLHKKGYDVTGIDLSENSIAEAKKHEDGHLHFFVHDMRKLLYINYFDIAVNLFTSFGYFETDYEHIKALKSFRKGLNENGLFVLDYFNVHKVIANIEPKSFVKANDISFEITKTIEKGKIIKNIKFQDNGENYDFTERVSAYTLNDFNRLFEASKLKVNNVFGDYNLGAFDKENSDRLIMICSKV
ncbi:class I SAM-dependent methyltransferase [Pedobacter flavus]|uniref:Class I SAM-dependent methyltransferase n=1 Tax=Pedobacter flavus TaxID=3113906 RepID=A0ABU7H1N4_9SPHI|nr:class I SAM-dependent methyltransferase [Pedobacter sp. VNH31]MEE1885238.1 class I SAM-dependent methyltransferase [Pedobacter sp. VNH31]